MTHKGPNRRRGAGDRRSSGDWIKWIVLAVLLILATLGGYWGHGAVPPRRVFVLDTTMIREANETQEELRRLASLVPDTVVRYVTRERLQIDTLPVPYTVTEACAPEIVEVPSPPVVVYDTTTIYQQAEIQLCPERTFWSSETYRPSIGNTFWSLGGFLLGAIVGGQMNNDARACVIVNGEEICEYP